MGVIPEKYVILIVDDEADVHTMSKLSLKKLRYQDKAVELHSAMSGSEALEFMQAHPDTAVVLLDVVMESKQAGLDTCKAIREELNNDTTRILLRTGQPGNAPEKTVIETYEIDGYLAKAELTNTRLFTAVRTAIKAYSELKTSRWLDDILTHLHQSSHRLFLADLNETVTQILTTALTVCPASLGILKIDFEDEDSQSLVVFHDETGHPEAEIAEHIDHVEAHGDFAQAGPFETGYLLPLSLPHHMGSGWLYLNAKVEDMATAKALYLFAHQVTLAVYSTVIQQQLLAYQGAELLEI